MSTNTLALMNHLAQLRVPFTDNLKAGPAAAAATATVAISMASRFTSSPGNTGSCVLKDMITDDCPNVYWIINDSGFTLNVYPNQNGTQTINGAGTALTVASGGFAFFVRVRSASDWRAAVFT